MNIQKNKIPLHEYILKKPKEIENNPHKNIENYLTCHIFRQILATSNYFIIFMLCIKSFTMESILFTIKKVGIFGFLSVMGNTLGSLATRDVREASTYGSRISLFYPLTCNLSSMTVMIFSIFSSFDVFLHVFGNGNNVLIILFGMIAINLLFVPLFLHIFWICDLFRWNREIKSREIEVALNGYYTNK